MGSEVDSWEEEGREEGEVDEGDDVTPPLCELDMRESRDEWFVRPEEVKNSVTCDPVTCDLVTSGA